MEWSLNNSLEMLGTEYVDCFLIHWPFAVEKTEDNDVRVGPDGKVCLRNSVSHCFQLRLSVRSQERTHRKSGTNLENTGEAL